MSNERRREYLCMFNVPDLDSLLYAIRLIFEYRCEEFDANIVESMFGKIILDKGGNVLLPDGHTRHHSFSNARNYQNWVNKMLELLSVDKIYYKNITQKVTRLSYEGLRREYDTLPKEILDKIDELSTRGII